jgi:hypothetical protein
MLYTDWWVTSLCEVVMVTHQTHQTFQTSPDVQTCPDKPRRTQTYPEVPQTPRRPDAQTPASRLPDACQTPARRSQTQPDVPDARAQVGLSLATAFSDPSDEAELLGNELQLQCVPENVTDFKYASLRGYSLARFLRLAAAKEKWRGDRERTLDLEIEDREHFMLPFGELMGRGWRVPEKESTVAGAKRRRTRNKGWLLPFFHDDVDGGKTNKLTYNLETTRLAICVSLGFFGDGLQFRARLRVAAAPRGAG